MNKDKVFNFMHDQTEIDMGYYYGLTEHIGVNLVGIQYKDNKWALCVWNDYSDTMVSEIELKEEEAIEYIMYDVKLKSYKEKRIEFIEQMLKENDENKEYYNDYIKE